VCGQAPSSLSGPDTQLDSHPRCEDRPVPWAFAPCDSGVTCHGCATFYAGHFPLVDFVCGHSGFRCHYCGEAIIITTNERIEA
jgi:hypothetical protein